MGTLRNQSAIKQQRLILERQPAAQAVGSHPDEVEQICGELIVAGSLIRDREMILLPYAIEKREHSMIEKIEKTPERSVLVASAIHREFGVLIRKHSQGTG